MRRPQHGRQPVGRLRGQRLRRRHRRPGRARAARSSTRSSRRTSPGRASAPARSTSSSRTGATPTWRRSSSPTRATAPRWTSGPQGNVGIIGWFVPPWLAEEHPDILDYENLNKYASGVRDLGVRRQGPVPRRRPVVRPVRRGDREQPRPRLQGRLLRLGGRHASRRSARPRRTRSGSSATCTSRSTSTPRWRCSEVALPPYEEGCQDDPQTVACDYPETELKKIVGTEWAESDSTAVDLVQNFTWTNEDQNVVAGYIAADGMSPEDAAAKWIEENQDKVDAWLG